MKIPTEYSGAIRGLRTAARACLLAVLLGGLLGANALGGGQNQTKAAQDQTKTAPDQTKTAPSQPSATPDQTNTTPQQAKPAPDQAKSAPDQAKITVESKVVTVFATVRDKHGQIATNLTKDDFAVDEDGRPQTISYFARENDLPLTTGLLVDTSLSQRRVLDQEVDASYTFLDHVLRDKDKAFIIHFDHEVELLTDLTSSRQKLDAGLKAIKAPQLADASDKGSHHSGGGTLLYDAVYLASEELMKKQQGRKALIILSDGVDRGSKESLHSAIESAQRANTVVYSILFKGDEPGQHSGYGGGGYGGGGYGGHGGGGRSRYPRQEEQRPDGKKVLERISKETGGRLFEVTKKETVDKIYSEIEQELREQYVLGYAPDKGQTGTSYHKIHLTTKQKDLAVQARDGYYSE
jgi:VWFA-related protein